jgi:hypothetical protein
MRTQAKFKEYIWLVNTINKARAISFTDIQKKWLETDMSEGIELARSTFNRHKDAIEDIFGIYIECNRKNGYKYSIGNPEALESDSIQNWMLATLASNNIISECVSLQDRIVLETVPYEGESLKLILDAMKRNIKITILYKRYGNTNAKSYTIEPYCIKLHKQRWYVLGHFHYTEAETQEVKERECRRLEEFVENRCELIVVVTSDVSEAFQFFDSQNARGKALYPHDLLKAYHLREMIGIEENEVERIVKGWEQISQSGSEIQRIHLVGKHHQQSPSYFFYRYSKEMA